MGTEYTLWKSKDGKKRVYIDEMSNLLSLCLETENIIHSTKSMPCADMLKLLMEGIKSTSYWMSEEEFKKIFSKLEVYTF